MNHRKLLSTALFVVATPSACSRSAPPRPIVTAAPVAPRADAGMTGTVVHAIPPPPPRERVEGAPSLAWAGGRVLAGVAGRIDALRITARGDHGRLAVNYVVRVQRDEDHSSNQSHASIVDLDPAAAALASPDPAPDHARLAAPISLHDEMKIINDAFGVAGMTGVGANSLPSLITDELAASDDGEGFAAAAVGTELQCESDDAENPYLCADGAPETVQRSTLQFYVDGRSGFSVRVLTRSPAGLVETRLQNVACGRARDRWHGDDDVMGTEIPSPLPDTRCSSARAHRADDVAVAYHPTHAAVAWRADHTLYVALVGPTGAQHGTPKVIAHGDVGAPALAWNGDTLTAIWAQRPRASVPYALTYVQWAASADAAVPPAQTLATGTAPAFAPALVTLGDRTLLAWTEGNDRTASVHVGCSYAGLAHTVDHAISLAGADRNARDPELAWARNAETGWITWTERAAGLSGSGPDGEVRVSPLRCP